ncbi:MAG: hypothetical protein Ct9H300mP1_28100 [Planctomycetaceae bacterium]|nr:MAG: hypothetical protein Ct9H300mP1_28100 [Planctomycetaceae bacterium]
MSGLLAAGVAASSGSEFLAAARRKLPVAAVVTEYRNNSHADVIVGKVLEGWRQDGQAGPDLRLVSMYTDQVPKGDLSRGLAEKHRFPIVKTIEQAIRQPGGDDRIEGVLSIGEHGNYPYTKTTRQHMYPRRRFFDEIVAAMQKAGRIVPVFSDKHLGWKFSDALHMVKTARKLKIPFMAGSSLPTCWRYPSLTLERGVEIEEAMAVGYGGLEAYGFHTLETLQCMIERRKGGETGLVPCRLSVARDWSRRGRPVVGPRNCSRRRWGRCLPSSDQTGDRAGCRETCHGLSHGTPRWTEILGRDGQRVQQSVLFCRETERPQGAGCRLVPPRGGQTLRPLRTPVAGHRGDVPYGPAGLPRSNGR